MKDSGRPLFIFGIILLFFAFFTGDSPATGWLVFAGFVVLIVWSSKYGKKKTPLPSVIYAGSGRSLSERNMDIINSYVEKLYGGDRHHYLDNKVKDCIGEIAKREGKTNLIPKFREWLSLWLNRSDVPQEYKDLASLIKEKFTERIEQQRKETQIRAEEADRKYKEELDSRCQGFFESNKDLINKFLEITYRKVSIIDDYGDENWDVLPKEIETIIYKIAKKADYTDEDIKRWKKYNSMPEEYEWLEKKLEKEFRDYHKNKQFSPRARTDLNGLSGVGFETYIAKLLKENGYNDVRGTPTTGDQGADLIAKKEGRTIIIQAKRYQGAVGNKAVQEVAAAVSFYNGNEGWVITNSTFTPSAKALAQTNGIKLIDGHALAKIQEYI